MSPTPTALAWRDAAGSCCSLRAPVAARRPHRRRPPPDQGHRRPSRTWRRSSGKLQPRRGPGRRRRKQPRRRHHHRRRRRRDQRARRRLQALGGVSGDEELSTVRDHRRPLPLAAGRSRPAFVAPPSWRSSRDDFTNSSRWRTWRRSSQVTAATHDPDDDVAVRALALRASSAAGKPWPLRHA